MQADDMFAGQLYGNGPVDQCTWYLWKKRLSFFLAGDLLPSSSDSDDQAAFERTGPLIVHLKYWMPSTTGMAENV